MTIPTIGKSFSKKIAALSLAVEVDIDPRKYASKEDFEELRELQGKIESSAISTQQPAKKQPKQRKDTVVIHKLTGSVPCGLSFWF